jgi:hypothetical protein
LICAKAIAGEEHAMGKIIRILRRHWPAAGPAHIAVQMLCYVICAAIGGTFVYGCGDSKKAAPTETLGGTVSGLPSGTTITLNDVTGGERLGVTTGSGSYNFETNGVPTLFPDGDGYAVTIAAQPPGYVCTLANANGTFSATAGNVTNVNVTCNFSVTGVLSGLPAAASVVLQDNAADNLTLSANGSFTFATGIASGAGYAVTVLTQPAGATCSVTNGSSTAISAPVTNVTVSCVPTGTFTVGGAVSNLPTGASLTLQDNGGDNLVVTANGSFTFPTGLAPGAAYAVTVLTQPTNATCTVTNGSGPSISAAVTNVAVSCVATPTFTVGGTLSSLPAGTSVVLQDNGGDNLTLSANGSFTFATSLAQGAAYAVTVLTQPSGATCTVTNGSGPSIAAAVTNVAVSCLPNGPFTVGGTVSGLPTGSQVTLQDNGGDNLTVTANGSFAFHTALAHGAAYAVTVLTQPSGATCAVANGSGNLAYANITGVAVTCSTATTVLGVVTNVATGSGGTGPYTSTITLYNLASKTNPTVIGTLTNAGNVVAIAIDPASNVYYLANTGNAGTPGTFFACPAPAAGSAYSCAQRGTTGAIGEAQSLAVDGQGNAYATQFSSNGTGVVRFPLAAGPIPGSVTGNMTIVYTSASTPGQYYGLAVTPDGSSAVYVSEGPGGFNYGTGVTMHVCAIPCTTPGGTDVTTALITASGQSLANLSGAVAVGPNNSVYVAIADAAGTTTGSPTNGVGFVCSVGGTVAAPSYQCAAGRQSYPLADATISSFAQTAAIAADPSGNMYLGVDLSNYGDSTVSPSPAFLGFLAPVGTATTLTAFAITGPQGPAVNGSLYSEPPYAIAITAP